MTTEGLVFEDNKLDFGYTDANRRTLIGVVALSSGNIAVMDWLLSEGCPINSGKERATGYRGAKVGNLLHFMLLSNMCMSKGSANVFKWLKKNNGSYDENSVVNMLWGRQKIHPNLYPASYITKISGTYKLPIQFQMFLTPTLNYKCSAHKAYKFITGYYDIAVSDSKGNNLLHHMCHSENKLLENKFLATVFSTTVDVTIFYDIKHTVNDQNISGDTPLHIAAQNLNGAMIHVLMTHLQADKTVKNNDGFTAYDCLRNRFKSESIFFDNTFYLLKYGMVCELMGETVFDEIKDLYNDHCKKKLYNSEVLWCHYLVSIYRYP